MTADTVTIDGAAGEGGGQILRSALSLSMLTGRALRIDNIRAGRDKPGLLRQHLTAVQAAAEICGADVHGALAGSRTLDFRPGPIRAGDYRWAIGTAGSCTLVLQTVLPALWRAGGPSRVRIEGGTHNPGAPPSDFLQHAWLPLLTRIGLHAELTLLRHGFFPAGGGAIEATVTPATVVEPLWLEDRGERHAQRAEALFAALPASIAERELAEVGTRLGWPPESLALHGLPAACGPGNALSLRIDSEHVTELFTAFGERGVSAETVARRVCNTAKRYLASRAAVGPYLADQLLLPLALAGGSFTTVEPSAHTRSNLDVIRRFLPDLRIGFDELGPDLWRIRAGGQEG